MCFISILYKYNVQLQLADVCMTGNVAFKSERKGRTLHCEYNPIEIGLYVIHIRWSGQEIDISPILVYVFDTYEELNRYAYQLAISLMFQSHLARVLYDLLVFEVASPRNADCAPSACK